MQVCTISISRVRVLVNLGIFLDLHMWISLRFSYSREILVHQHDVRLRILWIRWSCYPSYDLQTWCRCWGSEQKKNSYKPFPIIYLCSVEKLRSSGDPLVQMHAWQTLSTVSAPSDCTPYISAIELAHTQTHSRHVRVVVWSACSDACMTNPDAAVQCSLSSLLRYVLGVAQVENAGARQTCISMPAFVGRYSRWTKGVHVRYL
jgi:hypothetical protein